MILQIKNKVKEEGGQKTPKNSTIFNALLFFLHPGLQIQEPAERTVGSQRLYMTVALAKEVTLLDFRHKPDTNSTPLQPIQTDHSITFRQIRSKERRLNLICNAMNYKIKKSDMAHSHSLKPTNTNHTLFFFDSINLKNLFYTFLVVY